MDDYISKFVNFEIMFNMIEINIKVWEVVIEYNSIIYNYIDNFVKIIGFEKEDVIEIFEEYIKCLLDLLLGINDVIENNNFKKLEGLVYELKGLIGILRMDFIY